METSRQIAVRGAAAGVAGALVLAVWFVVVDYVRATPLDTLGFVTTLVFDHGAVGLAAMAAYTLVHFASFVLVGAVIALAVEKLEIPTSPLVGIVLGFFLFDVVFYAAVVFAGMDIVDHVGWPFLLGGNVLAGLTLTLILRGLGLGPATGVRHGLRRAGTVRTGALAGVVGALAVMLWFFLLDVARGNPLYTPGALGSVVLHGARGADEVRITAQTVLGYTCVHFALFVAAGLALAALARAARRFPPFVFGLALGLFTLQTMVTGAMVALMSWMLDALSWWSLAGANALAVIAMGAVLARRHPEMRQGMDADIEEQEASPGSP